MDGYDDWINKKGAVVELNRQKCGSQQPEREFTQKWRVNEYNFIGI